MTACDLAVVGGGPAGMAAASLAAELGLSVHVYDEQRAPGGQIYRAVERVAQDRAGDFDRLGDDYRQGLGLVERFRRSGARYLPDSTVWEVSPLPDGGIRLGITRDGTAQLIEAQRAIIASGAMERPVPVPGWTLPGVMTAGAAQTLLKASALRPDVPTVIAGSGPLIYLVAWQLVRAGAPLSAMLLTTPRSQYLSATRHAAGALMAGAELWKGLRWAREVRRSGVRIVGGVRAVAASGKDHLERVSYTAGGRQHAVDAGLLLLHEGVIPNVQLAMAAGCRHRWDQRQRCWRPEIDRWGNTSVPGLAIAGDGAGISGAKAAVPFGRLAALEAAHVLNGLSADERDMRATSERAAAARALRPRPFLDALFRPAIAMVVPDGPETVVCRCEEVTAAELRAVVAMGCTGPNQAKAFTRCGMGPCQGRMCGTTISELIAAERRVPVADVGHYRVRPPVKPVTVGEMAGLEGTQGPPRLLGGLPTRARAET